MTDNMIPADKVKEIIDMMKDTIDNGQERNTEELARDESTAYWMDFFTDLMPAPRTLADELRAFEARGHWDSEQLDDFADRVELLEQERDEGNRAVNEVRDWSHDVSVENKRLSEELSEVRVLVEEQAAEIARLEGLEVPGGWRVANHDHFGPVVAADTLDSGKYHCVFRSNVGPGISQTLAEPALLSFWDEAPAPEPDHIDPASCGRYRPYLVEYDGMESRAVRTFDSAPWLLLDSIVFLDDEDLTVLRPLSSEEMDAR